MRVAVFEIVFLLVILKIPIVYLCAVVWWAIRAEPRPLEGAPMPAELPTPPCPWTRNRRRGPRPGPRGGLQRTSRAAPPWARVRLDA
jgi:hypothetical protein